ncbi:EpsG family protein [Pseudomonas sp. NPDC089407]|uniref:EpsG family protein n=1 Tax=Pseudomonas sp. NPDC089407 TaxID=3364464 RepID=UPI00385036D9
MSFYLLVALALWLLSILGMLSVRSTPAEWVLGVALVWFVCALRYETGFDWMVYESYFQGVASGPFLSPPDNVVAMEPLYYLLNYAVAQFGSFQVLLLIVGSFNVMCTVYFFKHFNIRIVFGLAYVFCWVFLPLEMGTIRQSVAVSAMLVSMVMVSEGKPKTSLLWFVIALGFQFSAIIYGVIYLRNVLRPVIKHAVGVAVCCVLFYCIAPAGIGQAVLGFVAQLNLPFISRKLGYYAEYGGSPRSLAGHGFLLLNCLLLIAARYTLDYLSPRQLLLCSLLLCLIAAQAFLFDFALIWNRVHYLAAFVQAVLIHDILKSQALPLRAPGFLLAVGVSLAAIGMFLRSPASLPFVPYQSYVTKAWLNDPGDGRARTLEYYRMFEEAEKARNN